MAGLAQDQREPYDAGEIKMVFGLVGLCIAWICMVAIWKRYKAAAASGGEKAE